MYVRRPSAQILVLGMGGSGGEIVSHTPQPITITLLPLLTGIRKGEGVQGRGMLMSGKSGSGGIPDGSGPQKAAAGDGRGQGGAGGQKGVVRAWWCTPPGAGPGEGASPGRLAGSRSRVWGARAVCTFSWGVWIHLVVWVRGVGGGGGGGHSSSLLSWGIPPLSLSLSLDALREAGAVGGRAGALVSFLGAWRRVGAG